MTTHDSHIGSHSQHRLSDQVSANTFQIFLASLSSSSSAVTISPAVAVYDHNWLILAYRGMVAYQKRKKPATAVGHA